ncbi:GNAT family N-acetyltransferase [Clostridium sp. Sa3CUN1]|uniref:GNAT family N-acetyltransferase n=1 Tax=Clostridium gallinarum TaxID=2762246 RepID=A0ABR8Q884_9CLOT|nr:GNAT family protein [Clostridium gallinarum]MBD7916640.1 GNAT family N-acetyltransferase [Clostridium gallinarum]
MSEIKEVIIELVKGSLNEYIIKDKDNIFIGRFTIVELDKKNKKCNLKLKFFKENKQNLLRETVINILRAVFKDSTIYKVNILVDENINYKVFLDLGFTLEGIFTENIFLNGVFLDELSFGINRFEFNSKQRNYIVKLKSKNLILKSFTPDCTEELLDYYKRNKEHLKDYEPTRDNSFYTYEAQKELIIESYKNLMSGTGIDLGIYKADKLIGKIKISNIVYGVFKSGIVGYSIDEEYQGKGYMQEALKVVLKYAEEELELHRLEASVLTDNIKSKSVLLKCGFKEIGVNEKYLFINGAWRDHITFYKILDR